MGLGYRRRSPGGVLRSALFSTSKTMAQTKGNSSTATKSRLIQDITVIVYDDQTTSEWHNTMQEAN